MRVIICLLKAWLMPMSRKDGTLSLRRSSITLYCIPVKNWRRTVSYTHLDVYKRQVLVESVVTDLGVVILVEMVVLVVLVVMLTLEQCIQLAA